MAWPDPGKIARLEQMILRVGFLSVAQHHICVVACKLHRNQASKASVVFDLIWFGLVWFGLVVHSLFSLIP